MVTKKYFTLKLRKSQILRVRTLHCLCRRRYGMIEASRMKRKVIFFVILLLLVAGIGAVVKLISNRSPKEGELRVEVNPPVSMFLDNKHVGMTPYREKIAAGEYTIRLVPESATVNLAAWQGKVTVGPNLLTYVTATMSDSELSTAVDILWLEKSVTDSPELSVITTPDGATVVVDDATKGITPLTVQDIESGEHTMTVSSPGFLTRTLKIKLTQGFKLIANLKLALSGAGSGDAASETPTATDSADLSSTPAPTGTDDGTTSATPQKPYVTIDDTPVGFLRVRMGPTTSATEAGRVDPGEKFHVFDEESGWYQISYDGTNKGWVSGQYATKTE